MYCCDLPFELAAKLTDKDAQILRLMRRLGSPYGRQQGAMGEGLAGMPRQVEEQLELRGRQVQAFAVHRGRVRGHQSRSRRSRWRFRGPVRRASQVGPHARQQLLNAERLGHIVVRAGVERLNLRSFLIAHREHDDGGRGLAADPAAESTPLIPGIIRSVTTRSGLHSSNKSSASSGSLAARTS